MQENGNQNSYFRFMREDVLHYLWKSQRFRKEHLRTSSNEPIAVIQQGQYNTSSGPDFFNARLQVAQQEWAGNLEIHIKSSDWYAHGHEKDPSYDNIILHVVWEDDMDVFRKDGTLVPTLALKEYVSDGLLSSCRDLIESKTYKFINCEKDAVHIEKIVWTQWQERLYVERLEQKSKAIKLLLQETKNDWEAVLFILLMKNFGLNRNGEAFWAIARHLGYDIIRKVSNDALKMESLFFGVAGLLPHEDVIDEYVLDLKREFGFLRNKYAISPYNGERPIFFGLRPPNFPTVRLSQLAALYNSFPGLFGQLMEAKSQNDFFELFHIKASEYWDVHYTFGKESKKSKKYLSKSFVRLILINTLIPLKFCYHNYLGQNRTNDLLELVGQLPTEKNSIVERFSDMGVPSESAFESQAKIQLYQYHCSKNKCLQCQVGVSLLGRKN